MNEPMFEGTGGATAEVVDYATEQAYTQAQAHAQAQTHTETDFTGDGQSVTTSMDVFDTPEVEIKAPPSELHRAVFTGITAKTFDSGTTGVIISLTSLDTAQAFDYKFFPPTGFVENIKVDPNKDLSDTPPDGKKQSARQAYARTVKNSDHTAEFEVLRAIAREEGRTYSGAAPVTFEDFVNGHSELLAGVECIVKRKARKSDDPAFNNRLEVSGLAPKSELNDPKFGKRYGKWVLAWEQQG